MELRAECWAPAVYRVAFAMSMLTGGTAALRLAPLRSGTTLLPCPDADGKIALADLPPPVHLARPP